MVTRIKCFPCGGAGGRYVPTGFVGYVTGATTGSNQALRIWVPCDSCEGRGYSYSLSVVAQGEGK